MGCAAGLCAALRGLGKTAWVLPNEDATDLFAPYLEPYLAPDEAEPDVVVSVDIAGRGLFTPRGERWLERGIDFDFDHHPSYAGAGPASAGDGPAPLCGRVHRHRLLHVGQHHARHPPGSRRPHGDGH